MGTIGSLQSYFAMGFARGVGQMTGMLGAGQVSKADFNQLYVKAISDTKGGLEFKDLQNLARVLNEFDPELFKKFKKNAVKDAQKAKRQVADAFRGVGKDGPLGGVNRENRRYDKMATNPQIAKLSWAASMSKRNVVDATWRQPKTQRMTRSIMAGDKTLSIIRVRVRGGSYILADMAGKSNSARKQTGDYSRTYETMKYGKYKIKTKHRINRENVENWLNSLNSVSKNKTYPKAPSRFAWPAFEEYAKEYRKDFSNSIAELIMDTNRKLNS